MNMTQDLGVWVAAVLTLFIFSFLYKDNPLYKFAEHLFKIGTLKTMPKAWTDYYLPTSADLKGS